MPTIVELLRHRTDAERKRDRRFASVHGDMAYKEHTGMKGKLLGSPKKVDEGNGLDDCGTLRYTIQVPKHLTLKEIKGLLDATVHQDVGCGHSYDCCGCSSYSVGYKSVKRIRRGQFSFNLNHSRNY